MDIVELASTVGVSSVTAASTLWLSAKLIVNKWLDARFATRLEAVKLEGQRQLEANRQEHTAYIEQVRFERADLLDRSAKLNQREFEIVPDIWKKTAEAHYALIHLTNIWQEGTDVGRMPEPQFEEFIAASQLEQWQRDEIRGKGSFERTSYYADAQAWLRLKTANDAVVEFNRSIAFGNIFLHPDTHAEFEEYGGVLRRAYNRQSVNQRMKLDGDPSMKSTDDPVQFYRENGERLYQKLAKYLRERYWINSLGKAV